VVLSAGIALGSMMGIISGYKLCMYRLEYASISAAAQSAAVQRMEQTRAAHWELNSPNPVDEVQSSRFPAVTTTLDVPLVGTNVPTATVITTVSDLPGGSPMKWVQVDCVWRCGDRGPFTNRVTSLRIPEA
jgi:hypothetical protein